MADAVCFKRQMMITLVLSYISVCQDSFLKREGFEPGIKKASLVDFRQCLENICKSAYSSTDLADGLFLKRQGRVA